MDIQSLTANTAGTNPTPQAIDGKAALANENTFLQLLIAQIKNQDPTQPIDSTAFITQLAQFSQLEQLIGIRQDLQQQTSAPAAPAAATDGN